MSVPNSAVNTDSDAASVTESNSVSSLVGTDATYAGAVYETDATTVLPSEEDDDAEEDWSVSGSDSADYDNVIFFANAQNLVIYHNGMVYNPNDGLNARLRYPNTDEDLDARLYTATSASEGSIADDELDSELEDGPDAGPSTFAPAVQAILDGPLVFGDEFDEGYAPDVEDNEDDEDDEVDEVDEDDEVDEVDEVQESADADADDEQYRAYSDTVFDYEQYSDDFAAAFDHESAEMASNADAEDGENGGVLLVPSYITALPDRSDDGWVSTPTGLDAVFNDYDDDDDDEDGGAPTGLGPASDFDDEDGGAPITP